MPQSVKISLLILCTLVLIIIDLSTGSVSIPFGDVMASLFDFYSLESKYEAIIWAKRIPHTLIALIAGIGLSTSGLIMQTIFRNPLAGPYVLGVSSGASLGVALLLLGGISSSIGVPFSAIIGAIATLSLITLFANKIKSSSIILIIGLMLSYFVSAFTSFLLSISSAEQIQSFSLWGLGSFSKVNLTEISVISTIVIIGLIFFFVQHKKLSIYLIGDDYAQSLGVNASRLRFISVLFVGLISGVITAYCGPIAFVGMAVPHLARSFSTGSSHFEYTINTVFIGAIFILICDIISETPLYNQAIPINSLTCLLGAPIVIWVLYRMRSRA